MCKAARIKKGREEKPKKVKLAEADYWKLIAYQREVLLARQSAIEQVSTAAAKHDACLGELAERYPDLKVRDVNYVMNDEQCTLTPTAAKK